MEIRQKKAFDPQTLSVTRLRKSTAIFRAQICHAIFYNDRVTAQPRLDSWMQSSTARLNAGTAGRAAPERSEKQMRKPEDEMRQWTNAVRVFGALADVNLEGTQSASGRKCKRLSNHKDARDDFLSYGV